MSEYIGTCSVCGEDQGVRSLSVWRDADGEGWWIHPDCAAGFSLTAKSRIEPPSVVSS
ncbi:hypothetical protein ABIE52_003704 [Rhodococcus sp. OAS809]|uniref:hypothetical protein n=1 Tax=Rhodococcus sp. OAS809 TaxID=2663874 RepID=UPI00178B85C7